MSTHLQQAFLTAVLGVDGAGALSKAIERQPELAEVLVPRTVLSFVTTVQDLAYRGPIPGTPDSMIALTKSGGVISGTSYTGPDANRYTMAAHLAILLDVASSSKLAKNTSNLDLTRLGKAIDLLVRSRMVRIARGLEKGENPPKPGPDGRVIHAKDVDVLQHGERKAYTVHVDGQHIGRVSRRNDTKTFADAWHAVSNHSAHQGKTHKTNTKENSIKHLVVIHDTVQKTDLPGLVAKPVKQDGPQAAEPPQKAPSAGNAAASKKTLKPTKKPVETKENILGIKIPKVTEFKVAKSDALNSRCGVCGQAQFRSDGGFWGCVCMRGLAPFSVVKSEGDHFVIKFGSEWDTDAVETLFGCLHNTEEQS